MEGLPGAAGSQEIEVASMSGPTKIEWTDSTWSPVTGCTKVSAGCTHCYAERMAKRLAGRAGYPEENPFAVTLHPERLDDPLRWRKPRRVFVCSMSDLFHPDVPDEFIARVWTRMHQKGDCTFQILTKRPERMAAWLSRRGNGGGFGWMTHNNTEPEKAYEGTGIIVGYANNWPLPNVWAGTSVEDQATADERIPHLLRCPAAVRFVSVEPLLGPVDLRRVVCNDGDALGESLQNLGLDAGLDWVIAGGESGPKARPCHLEHLRTVVEQCRAAGVPCFVKQLGRYPSSDRPETYWDPLWADKTCTRLSGRYAPSGGLSHKGGDPIAWPEDLRVREFPKGGA